MATNKIAKHLLLDETCNKCIYKMHRARAIPGDTYDAICDNRYFTAGQPEMPLPEENTCEYWAESFLRGKR